MRGVLYRLYYKIRRSEIEKAKIRLKKMKVDTILQCLTKDCWKNNIQYELIIKTNEMFIIKLFGRRTNSLFKYHNTEMVYIDDFKRFVYDFELSDASKAIYITTGVFEPKIIKLRHSMFFNKKVKIYDNYAFIKNQLGFNGTVQEIFNKKKLKFFDYFPG